jgi:hypothetical protein
MVQLHKMGQQQTQTNTNITPNTTKTLVAMVATHLLQQGGSFPLTAE